MWSWVHPRVRRRPLGWLLVLLALCSLQVHAFQRVMASDAMAIMDPDICYALGAADAPAIDPGSDFVTASSDGDAADHDHGHCSHDCVCAHLNLMAPAPAMLALMAVPPRFELLAAAEDAPVSPAWPSGQPRGPPQT
jgi:hypothetical protein